MYTSYEKEGFSISLNDNFLKKHMSKEFLDIGIQRAEIGRIDRDNISIEILYAGFGNLQHKRTGQLYDDIRFTTEQWEKVKAHYRVNPHLYNYYHFNLLVRTSEGDIPVCTNEIHTNKLDFSIEQMLIQLYVQHVACKTKEELAAIREKKRLPFRPGVPIAFS